MHGRISVFSAAAACVLCGFASVAAWGQYPKTGTELPDFKATDALTGKSFSLQDLRGSIVLIDFWATWCGPCLRELPNVKKAYDKYHAQGFEIVSISLDKDIPKCKSFVKEHKMNWYHVIEGGEWKTRLARQYEIHGIPDAFVLDANGVVVASHARGEGLFDAIEQAMKKTPPKPKSKSAASAEQQLAQAEALLEKKEYAAAAQAFETIRKEYPDTEAAAAAARHLAEMREDQEIAGVLDQAARQKERPDAQKQADNWLQMARSLAKAGNFNAARKHYQRIIDEFPDSEAAARAEQEMKELPK